MRKNSVTASPAPQRLRSSSLDERYVINRSFDHADQLVNTSSLRASPRRLASLGDYIPDGKVVTEMRLDEVCRGECLNYLEVIQREPSQTFIASVIREESCSTSGTTTLTADEDEEVGASLSTGDDGQKRKRQKKKARIKKIKRMTGDEAIRDLCIKGIKDIVSSIVVFFLMTVIYVSGAHSILAPYYDGSMTFVALKTFLAGSATIGLIFGFFSNVPWAVGSVDVGFLPLLGHLAQICYHGVVDDKKEHRTSFAATYILAQSVMFLFAGISLSLVGSFRLTRLSNYLPYPVVAGLLASIGVSLVKSGISVAASAGFQVSYYLGFSWLFSAILLTYISHFLKRHLHLPGYIATPIIVFGATVFTWSAVYIFLDQVTNLQYYGILFKQESNKADSSYWLYTNKFLHLVDYQTALWGESRSVFFAAAVIAALKIGIKCGSFSAMFPTVSMDVDHEVQLAGISHIIAAFLGLAGQAHSFSGIKVQQQLQASTRAPSFLVALWCLFAWFYGVGPILSIIPRYVFGALLIELGIDYIHTYMFYPMRKFLTTFSAEDGHEFGNLDLVDCATLVSIVITALLTNLLEAIALGLVLSLVGVSRRLAQRSIISRLATGRAIRSTIERSPPAMRTLETLGESITIIDMVGYIFFGSAQELVDLVLDRANIQSPPYLRHLVLDVSRCFAQFDVTAIAAFEKILAIAHAKEFRVAFAPSDCDAALALDRGIRACTEDTIYHFDQTALWFHTVDDALEFCEDDLLNWNDSIETTSKHSSNGFMYGTYQQSDDEITATDEEDDTPKFSNIYNTQDDDDNIGFDVGVDLTSSDDDNEGIGINQKQDNAKKESSSALTALSDASARFFKKKQMLKSWLNASAVPLQFIGLNEDEKFIQILANLVSISHEASLTDNDGDRVICMLVDGRVRLLNTDNMCVRKLTEGSCVGIGNFYAFDAASSDDFTLVPNSPHITFLLLKYSHLTQLESEHPDVAIAFHKLMARSLAQKNRNSKLQHRTD